MYAAMKSYILLSYKITEDERFVFLLSCITLLCGIGILT
jgi:hypothetical protein